MMKIQYQRFFSTDNPSKGTPLLRDKLLHVFFS